MIGMRVVVVGVIWAWDLEIRYVDFYRSVDGLLPMAK